MRLYLVHHLYERNLIRESFLGGDILLRAYTEGDHLGSQVSLAVSDAYGAALARFQVKVIVAESDSCVRHDQVYEVGVGPGPNICSQLVRAGGNKLEFGFLGREPKVFDG